MKMTRIVSRLKSQTRAQKIRSGTMTKAKTVGDMTGSSIQKQDLPMRELIVCGGGSEGIPGMANQETGKHINRYIGTGSGKRYKIRRDIRFRRRRLR
jgi:predicted Rossmann-fold nucleotide-binding protein